MTQPPALRHAHTLAHTHVYAASRAGWLGVCWATFSCTAAANTRSAYRKQAGEDKSRSDGAAGHAIAARVCGRLSPGPALRVSPIKYGAITQPYGSRAAPLLSLPFEAKTKASSHASFWFFRWVLKREDLPVECPQTPRTLTWTFFLQRDEG